MRGCAPDCKKSQRDGSQYFGVQCFQSAQKWTKAMSKNWIVTKDQFLTANEIQKLYQALHDAKDLALQRKSFFSHIRDYFILRTLLETGLRIFELAASCI